MHDQGIPVIAENALRWPKMDLIYLKVVGCLGAALVDLLGGVMDFKIVDGFGMFLETRLNLGGGGGWFRGAERTDGFKQVFPSDVNT